MTPTSEAADCRAGVRVNAAIELMTPTDPKITHLKISSARVAVKDFQFMLLGYGQGLDWHMEPPSGNDLARALTKLAHRLDRLDDESQIDEVIDLQVSLNRHVQDLRRNKRTGRKG